MGWFDSAKKIVGGGAKILTGNPIGGFKDQFDGVTGAFGGLPGGSSALDFIPGIGDARAQDKANKINIQQAEINRQFQERMSNTAYQRAMTDMKAAGLNPTLAYMQGGASAPSGATAQVESSSKTGLVNFALQSGLGIADMRNKATAVQQQQAMNESTIKLNASAAAKNVADAQRSQAETKGLGRKAAEGDLWNRFYKGINSVLDSSAKDAAQREKSDGPLIKKIGPVSDKERSGMFNWLAPKKP